MPTPELKIVCRIGEIIAGGAEFHESLEQITRIVAEGVGVEVCNILLHDAVTDRLILEATWGFGKEAVHKVWVKPGQGIVGYCFRTSEVVNTPQKQTHPNFKAFAADAAADYASLLAVPLVAGGRAIGVINLERKEAEVFPAAVVAMTQAIAAPVAAFARNRNLSKDLSAMRRGGHRKGASGLLKGTAVTRGVVRGHAYFLVGGDTLDRTPLERADDPAVEKVLLAKALKVAREDILDLQKEASKILAEAEAAIFYAHIVLLDDPSLVARVHAAIDRGLKLRSALKDAYLGFEEELHRVKNPLVTERLADLKDVVLRIYQAVDEIEGVAQRPSDMHASKAGSKPIVVAHELLPSQLIRLPLVELAGIICEAGGTTSHVAILARALHIPMVVGAAGAMVSVRSDDDLILDCTTGNCYVRPSVHVVERFAVALAVKEEDITVPLVCPVPMTKDGVQVRLGGNVSLLNEVPLLHHYGASGIGLYRTEFMFMIRNTYPNEDEQYGVFRRVVEGTGGGSVTIRLLDVGGDKPLPYVDFGVEDNPMLGWRGMRFLLGNPHLLEPHLRAILRTTVHGRVNILLPMVADLEELLALREFLQRAERQLKKAGIQVADTYRVGVMLEVPSALWALEDMLRYIDFVSIGTNDLIQYTFAVDRGNPKINRWFRQFHPLVLRMIKYACDVVAACPGKSLSICGEVAGNPLGSPLLIGAGVRYLSMNPNRIPQVVEALSKVTVPECEALLATAVTCQHDQDVVGLMQSFAEEHGITNGTVTPRAKRSRRRK